MNEIEKLHADCDRLERIIDEADGKMLDLILERDRLREALQAIVDHPKDEEWHTITDASMREIARCALANESYLGVTLIGSHTTKEDTHD
jgi:hypothetical protein